RNSANLELADFIAAKERWIDDLLALAPLAISKVAAKLAESIAIYGRDEFKPHVRDLSYAALLYKANSSSLTAEFLQQTFPTPDKWCQLMNDLGVATPSDR
ncbi:serine/threonine protein phosphatase, partial [Chamaesiphon polymorphus CCALA 037]